MPPRPSRELSRRFCQDGAWFARAVRWLLPAWLSLGATALAWAAQPDEVPAAAPVDTLVAAPMDSTLRVGEIRGASFDFEFAVEASGKLAAEATTVLASVDNRTGRPVKMPPDVRSRLESLEVR